MNSFIQIKLLLWKNFTLRKRQKIRCIVELVWPLVLFLILMWVRTRGLKEYIHECHFEQKAMPSAGHLPFIHSFLCSFNNTCHETVAGATGSTNISLIARLLRDLEESAAFADVRASGNANVNNISSDIMAMATLVKSITSREKNVTGSIKVDNMIRREALKHRIKQQNITLSDKSMDSLLNAQLAIHNYTLSQFSVGYRPLVCNATFLSQIITNCTKDELDSLSNDLCNMSTSNLTSLLAIITTEIDTSRALEEMTGFTEKNLGRSLLWKNWKQLNEISEQVLVNFTTKDSYQDMISEVVNYVESYREVTAESSKRNLSSIYGRFLAAQRLLCGHDLQDTFSLTSRSGQLTRFDSFRELLNEIEDKRDGYVNDTDASPECNELFQMMESNSMTRLVWLQIKPFFRGKIVFSPNVTGVQRVMERVNEHFQSVEHLKDIVDDWFNKTLPQAKVQLDSDIDNIRFIKEFADSSLGRGLLTRTLVPSKEAAGDNTLREIVGRFLNDSEYRREAYSNLQDTHKSISLLLGCFDTNKIQGYATEEEATNKGMELLLQNKLWAVVVFLGVKSDDLPEFVSYKIRTDSSRVDDTRQVEDRLKRPGPRRRPAIDLKYLTFGFAFLQDMVEHSVIQEQTGVNNIPGIVLQQFPYPCYIIDIFVLSISRTFPLFMTLSWVYSCAMIIKSVVYEKEHRLKETMRVMGLGNGIHWVVWFLDSLAPTLVTVTMLTIVLVYGKVLERSDPSVVWVFLMIYCLATISLSFLISIFFSRANLSAAAGGLIFFVTYLPYPFMVLWEKFMTSTAKISTSVFSNVAFGFGCSYFAAYEEMGIGISWSNIGQSPILGDTYNLLYVMYMLLLDMVVYLILMWYIENVYPGQYGVPKPLYFPFQKSYWCGTRSVDSNQFLAALQDNVDASEANMEAEPTNMHAGVSLRQLGKVYQNGKVAVQNLSLNFYQDQITAFLGHNGAGKTTTISILTGLYSPTTGTAIVNGLDIRNDMDSIRTGLGVCPQHNVLFDQLTVKEHLWFFARLKGRSQKEVNEEIEKMLVDLQLTDKEHALSRELSGGMKRKLSIAAAFIGNSRTVILDEPTAGVDPFSRRAIWELLVKYKRGRTVILTTHFMDEADLLGDRIAIIANGTLRCCGSSLFLKANFGSGYYLTMETDKTVPTSSIQNSTSLADVEDTSENQQILSLPANQPSVSITDWVKTMVPSARLLQQLGSELLFVLPQRGNTNNFCELFDALDAEMISLGIKSYGISDTTLEEIFLKVVEKADMKGDKGSESDVEDDEIKKVKRGTWVKSLNRQCKWQRGQSSNHVQNENVPVVELNGFGEDIWNLQKKSPEKPNLKWRQFQALHIKHFHHTRRNPKGLISELVVPAVFVCMALGFTSVLPQLGMPPPLLLEPWLYKPPNNMFFSTESTMPMAKHMKEYEHHILGPIGIGTRCIYHDGERSSNCQPVVPGNLVGNGTVPSQSPTCSCKQGTPYCPAGAGGPPPLTTKVSTGDIMANMTGRNISDWLVKTTSQYLRIRYGGFSLGVSHPSRPTNTNDIMNISQSSELYKALVQSLDNIDLYNNIKVWFNNKGWASSVAYMNAINNVVLRTLLPPNMKKNEHLYGIQAINHPMNYTKDQMNDELIQQSGISLLHAIAVIFALSFVPASFVVFLIEERMCNSKHLQVVSGVNRIIYWLAAYSWDMACYVVSSILCLFVFVVFNEEAYVSYPNIFALALLLLLYGWATIPLMYPASFMFTIPSTAFVALACGNLFIGIITTVATFVLEVFNDDELQYIASVIRQVFLIFPQFCLGQGLMNMAKYHFQAKAVSANIPGMQLDVNLFEWGKLGKNYFCMLVAGILSFLLTLAIEYKIISFKKSSIKIPMDDLSSSDDDVAAERKRVLTGDTSGDVLLIKDLTKVYKSLPPAVLKLCVGVGRGECFGLLGLNGAGKTSTFKMLTGDTPVTAGEALVGNYSVRTELARVWQQLGYCPQFDALDNLLTVREHLHLYARLRGITGTSQQEVVNSNLEMLGLGHYSDCLAGNLSGGNKRKLSTAIALIGDPQLIFLDEPTTGMDPQARRFLWSCIQKLVKQGRSVVLTSHSMEECEALCTRLTIMVRGSFRCLGSCQHLKSKFGRGYVLVIRSPADKLAQALEHVRACLPDVNVRERHLNQIKLELTSERLALGEVFRCLEQARSDALLHDYSLTQTTLEEVFLRFANEESDNSKGDNVAV